ncbi:TetR/AcrR family transcriptional regulator [Cnuibacter sp. UC19_7]|uniref:TetR/AcrR family transcriptional regulator n=1 Tax=Cnuibacter sp. UC19_7 TaxID=3350166 RepID=UPI00366E1D1E
MTTELSRTLRADAEENRTRMVVAARALFAESGLDVGMREIARRAGVGAATLYRRFPTRNDLLSEVFALEVEACRSIVADACAHSDAWRGFEQAVRQLILLNVRHRGFIDAYMAVERTGDVFAEHRRLLLEMIDELGRRAKAQGMLRSDFTVDDLVIVLLAGRGLVSVAAERRPAAGRRFATLAIDAFRR